MNFTISNYVSGSIAVSNVVNAIYRSANGTYTLTEIGAGGNFKFFSSSFVGSVSNISVKKVNGNPAIMTNMTASDIENGSPYANIVTDGDFPTGTTAWTAPSGWTLGNGVAAWNAAGTYTWISQEVGVVVGKQFKVTFDCVINSGNLYVLLANGGDTPSITESGSYEFILTPTGGGSSDTKIRVYQTIANSDFTITNLTATEVNTGLQGYWKMGSGINDEYPVIYDQTNPTLGAELVTNGDFATDSDWIKQTGWTIANGKASISGQTQNRGISQDISVEAGKVHKVIYERTYISGNGETNLYSDFISDGVNTTLGSYSDTTQETVTVVFYFSPTYTGTMTLRVYAIGTFTGSIDNVSVKQVQGNPATMTNMVEGNITNQ